MTRRNALGAAVVVGPLAAGLLLAGCSDVAGADAYDGTGTAACPALPGDVVAAVAGDLSAEGEGYEPHQDRPQDGTLPVPPDTGDDIPFGCWWATTDGGAGLTVQVTVKNPASMEPEVRYVARQEGPELTASVPGTGRAFDAGGTAEARWVCDDRMLQVRLGSPADEGGDPLNSVQRLAEVLVPQIGCPTG
jgi:hypothetical protein